jgi:nicotinamide-nucleotide amidase
MQKKTKNYLFSLTLLVPVFGAPCGCMSSDSLPLAATVSATRYAIIVTGDELLTGIYADGHTPFLTRTLRPLGLECVAALSVGDTHEGLCAALEFAVQKAPLVLVTGGLGPTDNDITREALSRFTGIPLREDPDVLARIATRLATPPDQLRANLRRQCRVPTTGRHLDNPHGTAVGLVFESSGAVIVALPGPPHELQPMVRDELVPYLSRRFGVRPPGCSLQIRFIGIGQSRIAQVLTEQVRPDPDVLIGSQFADSRVDFSFWLAGDTAEDHSRLRRIERALREHLGEYIYATGDTSLEECVLGRLRTENATLAVLEVGTSGALAAALTSQGSRTGGDVLIGSFAASSVLGLARLMNVPNVPEGDDDSALRHLAECAVHQTAATWVVAVGPIRRDEQDRMVVHVALRGPDNSWHALPVPVRGVGSTARSGLVTAVLDHLRRRLP